MKTQAIVPAAGIGSRLKSKQVKPLIVLNGKPLVVHCLLAIEKCSKIDSVIVVVEEKYLKVFESVIKKFRLKKIKRIVPGGETRCDSVKKGISALDADTQNVLIHDGARPLITPTLISRAISALGSEAACVVGVAVKPTIKRVDPKTLYVQETLDRSILWEIQTPQVFRKEILVRAHELMLDQNPTDDAVLVEKMGIKVKMVPGDYQNIKVTTQEDLKIAKIFLQCRKV